MKTRHSNMTSFILPWVISHMFKKRYYAPTVNEQHVCALIPVSIVPMTIIDSKTDTSNFSIESITILAKSCKCDSVHELWSPKKGLISTMYKILWSTSTFAFALNKVLTRLLQLIVQWKLGVHVMPQHPRTLPLTWTTDPIAVGDFFSFLKRFISIDYSSMILYSD